MTGDTNDFISRLRAVLVPSWFPNKATPSPNVTGLLSGFATVAAFIYSLLAYIRLQTRIATATDGWLDLISYDFFGLRIQRATGQADASFRNTIITELFRPRNTRASYIKVLQDLTGRTPLIFEPGWSDAGFYNKTAYWGVTPLGSRSLAYTVFITAYRGNGASDAQIYAAVNSVRSAGITAWVSIQN